MTRGQQPALTFFSVGMIGLGILPLVYGDFAMVWQPVAPWVPGRTVLAYASGVIMLLGGVGLLVRPTAAWSVRILFPYLFVWMCLKLPALFVAPGMEAVWLGVWRACGAFRRRMGFVREDVRAARGDALRCDYQPKKHTRC